MSLRSIAVIVVGVWALVAAACGSSSAGQDGTAPVLTGPVDDVGATIGTDVGSSVPQAAGDSVASGGGSIDRLGFAEDSAGDDADQGVIVAQANVATITAYEEPDLAAPVVADLANPTAVGGPLVFQLLDPVFVPGRQWHEVYLPIRPNGSTGWIRSEQVTLSRNPFRIQVDTSDHLLEVFRNGEPWLTTTVAIGTGDTPTPLGNFYIIELLQPPTPDGVYGPFAFGLSGFSETLTSFAGGDGVVGIHGTNDPSALGSDVSHGCIRVANETIETMAAVIPLGTPVVIQA